VTIPAGIDELDAPFVAAALRDAGYELDVEAIDVEPFAEGSGYLGDLARIRLHYATGGGPESIVAKVPPADPGGRAVGRMLGVWRREHLFYSELARGLDLPVPHCYASLADVGEERYLLLLEDLGDLTTELSQVHGAEPEEARQAVEALADLHARWWGEAGGAIAWMPTIAAPAVGRGLQDAIVARLDVFERRFAGQVTATSVGALRRFAPRLAEWLERKAGGVLAVAHADYRLGNLRFGPDGVYVLDWQTAMRTAPATDLSIFAATSLTIAARRAQEDELLSSYAERLRTLGVEVDDGDLRRDYEESFLWWASMFANNLSTIESDDVTTRELFESMIERTHAAIDDLRPEPFA
jgi:thiamine kinase-like enzyme